MIMKSMLKQSLLGYAPSLRHLGAAAALATVFGSSTGLAGQLSYDFSTQPSDLTIGGNNPDWYVASGGNPGGFLALTYSVGSQKTAVVFPDTDPGKIVTGFSFSCDLRVGNPQTDRAADGFSISFARTGDPLLEDANSDMFGGNCCAETGTQTGIAVSFDTWQGNTFPNDPNDKSDIEGIIVRVDNVTVKKVSLPTRNGAADDITSLQTGPRDAAYWSGGGDPKDPGAWAGLAWKKFTIDLTPDGKLTVTYKGNKVLDGFQTAYFPSGGRLVFAGRTGGANENTDVDNIKLTTTAATVTAVPGAVGSLTAAEKGSRRVKLTWTAAVVAGDPVARIAYDVERDGVVVGSLLTGLSFEDRGVQPNTSYTYKVRGKNIAGNPGPDATLTVKTGVDVDGIAFVKAEQWTGISGTGIDAGTGADHFLNDPPDKVRFVNGFSYGETSNFGDTWGDNYIAKLSGVFTAPKTGNFRFFVRSDDASALYLNTSGAAIPDVTSATPIAEEKGCCNGFQEVGATQTSDVIALTKGTKYGIAFLVKEGGGGDWGQVAIREEGDTTKASDLTPLRGGVITSPVDGTGATVAFTTQPAALHVVANSEVTLKAEAAGSSPYGADSGNAVVYQWYINGDAILGANTSSYTFPAIPIALNNATVTVGAGVAGAWVVSNPAKLTIDPDTVPPTVKRINGSDTFDKVTVVFSEPVGDSALATSHYNITGLTVSGATRVNSRSVILTTSKQAVGTTYPVTVNGVLDNASLPSAYTGTFTSFIAKKGIAAQNDWLGQNGGFNTFVDNGVKDLPPSATAIVSDFNGNNSDQFDNYFRQTKALFTPTKTGNYVFFMASDDHGELYLSTDDNPANKKMIAQEPAWGGRRYWVGNGADNNSGTRGSDGSLSNRSDQFPSTEWPGGNTINLTANKSYYLELLYKEGGGGDHGSATFIAEGAALPDNANSALKGDLISWFYDPSLQPPEITVRPQPVLFANGDSITFSVTAKSATAAPPTYQWYKNKHAIPGATSATYTVAKAGAGDIGDYYVDVTNENGTTSSYPDNDSRASMKGAFVIEVEDFNYGGGKTIDAASKMPLVSGLYEGKDGILDVDFHNNNSTDDSGANGNSYRQGYTDAGGTVHNALPGSNVDVIIDDGGGGPGNQNRVRPDFELTHNYKIGWGDTGDWFNFTRSVAPGNYNVLVGYSHDGRDADAGGFALELVANPAVKDSPVTLVGETTHSWTGGWSSNDTIPFLTPGASTLASVPLGANSTLRLRLTKGGGGDIDYLLLYPAGGSAPSLKFSSIVRNADGTVTLTWDGSAKLTASPDVNGTYTPVAGAKSPFTFKPTEAHLFGKLAP